jgi:hypothetical protein
MTSSTFINLLSQLETLEPKELQELSQAVQIRLQATQEVDKIAKFYDSLLSSGLVRHRKQISPQQQVKPPLNRLLVEIQGKPISTTIIEERG